MDNGHFVYGVPFSDSQSETLREALEDEVEGFLSFYDGTADNPCAFGFVVKNFDAQGVLPVKDLIPEVSAEDQEKFRTMFRNIPSKIQIALFKVNTPPHLFLTWTDD